MNQQDHQNFLITLGILIILILITKIVSKYTQIKRITLRNLLHLCVGTACSFSVFYFKTIKYPIVLALIFLILNSYNLFFKRDILKVEPKNRDSFGTIYFPISFIIHTLFFWNHKYYFLLSFLILSISDPLASFFGKYLGGKRKFKLWHDEKTYYGTATFFISTFLLSFYFGTNIFNKEVMEAILFSIFISIGTTIAELISKKGTDNISISLTSILLMFGFEKHNKTLFSIAGMLEVNYLEAYMLILILFFITYKYKLLSKSGFFSGFIMTTCIWFLGGPKYILPIALFFILSSLLPNIFKEKKQVKVIKPKRDIIQVYANGGIALLFCIYNFFNPNELNFYLFLSSISAAMADTWATEIGKTSKKSPVSIINLKKVRKGLSGGVTVIGLIGSFMGPLILITIINQVYEIPARIFSLLVFIGFIGSIFDSFLGATVQGKYVTTQNVITEDSNGNILCSGYATINNSTVNFLNTIFSPALFYLIFIFM